MKRLAGAGVKTEPPLHAGLGCVSVLEVQMEDARAEVNNEPRKQYYPTISIDTLTYHFYIDPVSNEARLAG